MIAKELILKVTSSCNLNCGYCYVFNQGDSTYKQEPQFLNRKVMEAVIHRINQHCKKHRLKQFLVIFHGGEPLLAKKSFYSDFVEYAKANIENVEMLYGLQTNGTLLTQDWYTHLFAMDISIGVSLDGPLSASKYRVYKKTNENAYNEIIKGIKVIHENGSPINVLSVINVSESPESIYNHLKENKISNVDFLYPDITYDNRDKTATHVGDWLIKMFDLWYNDMDENKPLIRYLDTIVGMILGVERGYEVLGRKKNQTICVKSNGNIEPVDNLKVCGDGFTKTTFNVFDNILDDAFESELISKYYNCHQNKVLCIQCKKCIIKDICGGGSLPHRFSISNEFDNPSAYCRDIFSLVAHIQNTLIKDLPTELVLDMGIEKLTLKDCL